MKRIKLLTISLLAALTAFGGTYAYAAESDTIYPEDKDFIKSLTFTSLTDYAVNGEVYAFAENKTVFLYDNGTRSPHEFEKNISQVDCIEGTFYCRDVEGHVYSLPDKQSSDKVMPEEKTIINLGDFTYRLTATSLDVADFNTKEIVTFAGKYSNLKQYEDKVFAIKDNELYFFNEAEATKIELKYDDIAITENINVGQTASSLVNYTLKFVTIKAGAHMTEIDLDKPLEENFTLKSPDNIADNTSRLVEDKLALLLCYTGNAAIVAIGESSYILLKSNTQETKVDCYVENNFDKATLISDKIYASPYVIVGTPAIDNVAGVIVNIKAKIKLDDILDAVYYQIEYNNGEIGYVAEGFLTEFIIEDNKKPNVFEDPEYSEVNDTKTVLLILAVVVLVLAAVGYIAYVGTSGKKGKNRKKEKPEPDEEK